MARDGSVEITAVNRHTSGRPISERLYRYFDDPAHADDFVRGRIRVSTLGACRIHEDARGDPGEGTVTRNSGHINSSSMPIEQFRQIAASTGVVIHGAPENITVSGSRLTTQILDAFVLCLTMKPPPSGLEDRFGPFCLEVQQPRDFADVLTLEVRKRYPGKPNGICFVQYRSRDFIGLEQRTAPEACIKPADHFEIEQEVRLVWILESRTAAENLRPEFFESPHTKHHCKRIA